MSSKEEIFLLAGIKNPKKLKYAFELLIKTGLKLLKADEGSLLVYRKEFNDLQFASTTSKISDSEALIGKTVPVGRGIVGMAALTREVQTAKRAQGGEFFEVEDDGTPSCVIAAPVIIDEELTGVISAVSFDFDKSFTIEDCENFYILASLGAVIIKQEQQLEIYMQNKISNISKQDSFELEATEKVIELVRKHPDSENKILSLLTILSEL